MKSKFGKLIIKVSIIIITTAGLPIVDEGYRERTRATESGRGLPRADEGYLEWTRATDND
jgi:hypothetical protein